MKRWLLSALLSLVFAVPSLGHFVFVVPDAGAGKASVILSEDLEPDEGVDVKLIAGLKLSAQDAAGVSTPLALTAPAGHRYNVTLPNGAARVQGMLVFGVRNRAGGKGYLVEYYPRAIVGDPFSAAAGGSAPPAEIIAAGKSGALTLQVLAGGKPAPGAQVTVLLPDGNEEEVTTDAQGRTPPFKHTGRYGAWARVVEPRSGEHDGKTFDEIRRYPTLVIDVPGAARAAAEMPAALPEAVSSFGAAACDGWLYVYGGHTAPTHTYHTAAVSGRFHRFPLNGSSRPTWEALPGGPGLQGMNLVTLGSKVYRVGGMAPRNEQGSPDDNFSVADVVAFDPASRRWEPALPPLPAPRSSHDVVALGGRLFVVGGWELRGKTQDERWPDAALVIDLASERPQWREVPQPFRRRALIAAVHGDKVYAIAGFDENDKASRRVDIYDPAAGTWSAGPDLPPPARNGFGPAACMAEGRLYVSVGDGSLLRLDDAAGQWERIAQTTPRIVHRLVPIADQILVLGGAAKGKNFDLVEAVSIPIASARQPEPIAEGNEAAAR